jgi:hypothetical protein
VTTHWRQLDWFFGHERMTYDEEKGLRSVGGR